MIQTKCITNKKLYAAVRSSSRPIPTKEYTWPNVDKKSIFKALTRNHKSKCSGTIKQFRWLILTHSLPVRARLAKMSMNVPNFCPICGIRETIVHRISECTESKLVIQWLRHTWQAITQETIPKSEDPVWITNLPTTKFPIQLAAIIDITMYRCWLNRNKHAFQPDRVKSSHEMILDVARNLNIHIRAKLYQDDLAYEKAIYYDRAPPPLSKWTTIWKQIRSLSSLSPPWALLQAQTGRMQLYSWLHNPTRITEKF